jgi:hypothetical protein
LDRTPVVIVTVAFRCVIAFMATSKVDCVLSGFKLAANGVYDVLGSRTRSSKQLTVSPGVALDTLPPPLFDVVENVTFNAAESIGV